MQGRTLTHSGSPVGKQDPSMDLHDDPPAYDHASTFRSRHIELNIQSAGIEHVEDSKFIGQSIPVFNDKDSVRGTVITTIPAVISTDHRLTISLEGAFFWIAPQKEEPQSLPLASPLPTRIKHVFLSSTFTVPLSPSPPNYPMKPSMRIRSVLQEGIRNTIFRRTPSSKRHTEVTPSHNVNAEDAHIASEPSKTTHRFTFPLPVITGRKIPSTISVSRLCSGGIRGRWYAEGAQVAYKLTAHVYPAANGEENTRILEEQLEAPIFIESNDSSDIDRGLNSGSWSHSKMGCLKNLPFLCTLTLPHRASFSRSDPITFYVVFSTMPKSEALARRIINSAVIRVSLIRQLRLEPGLTMSAPSPNLRHSDKGQKRPSKQSKSSAIPSESRLPKIFTWHKKPSEPDREGSASTAQTMSPSLADKPLPPLPSESSSVYEHLICSVISEGFPKRAAPKNPSLSFGLSSGPEGLFKGQLRLSNELSNTIDWPGISLSYLVEASVQFENDTVRARDRVRLVEAYI